MQKCCQNSHFGDKFGSFEMTYSSINAFLLLMCVHWDETHNLFVAKAELYTLSYRNTKASTLKRTNPQSGQSHCRDYATMWNGIWRQRQEFESSVWCTHLAHFDITVCSTQSEIARIHPDVDLYKNCRKHISVIYENTIRHRRSESTTNLMPNANNIQQGHFLQQQNNGFLVQVIFHWYSPKGRQIQNYIVRQLQNENNYKFHLKYLNKQQIKTQCPSTLRYSSCFRRLRIGSCIQWQHP